MKITGKDLADLKKAAILLEKDSIAVKMANIFGEAAEKFVRLFPQRFQKSVETHTVMTIEKSWEFSLTTMAGPDVPPEPEKRHRLYAIISGAVGGVAILTLFAELPVTTVIMLRSVADIAKSEGEDYNRFETRIACLESFALGGENADRDKGGTSYYASREMLSKPLEESGKYIAKKGVAGMGAPFVAQLFAKIAARYQTFLSAKLAAEAVPLAGAVIGATVNIVFIDYFQEKARGHFIIRRLEKEYGIEEVKQAFEIEAVKERSVKDVSKEETDRILRQHAWASMGVGLIPLPLADLAGLTIVQLNMLRKLAKAYNVPFFKGVVKNILYSLGSGALPVAVSGPVAASMMKIVPVAGQGLSAATMPVAASASTYALGKIFIQHFASGGTFLTFDPEKVKAYYAEMFEEGEKVAGK